MAKDTFYFTHDYNAMQDEKIKKLIRFHGMEGYGIYWAIVEELYNNANALRTDYEGIAYALRVDGKTIKTIINDYELFIIDGEYFGSLSIEKRLDERSAKSAKARDSANKRWGNVDANASKNNANASKSDARKESKGKERKKVNKGNEGVNNNLSALPTSERENIFKQTLFPYLDMYGAEMLKAFFMYWTEKNSNGKKMRFDMEKVFDLPRRLATWKSRQKIDNGTASPQKSKSQQTYENVEGAKELIKKIYENE